jgi:hypothetical protein
MYDDGILLTVATSGREVGRALSGRHRPQNKAPNPQCLRQGRQHRISHACSGR